MVSFFKKVLYKTTSIFGIRVSRIPSKSTHQKEVEKTLNQYIEDFIALYPACSLQQGNILSIDNKAKIRITTREELVIIEEVFFNKIYSFQFNKKTTVIDIGMNVGIASIFFAANDNVTKVYSFEPFGTTFKDALFNIELNDTLQSKIIPHQFGIGGKDEMVTATYSSDFKGMNSASRDQNTLEWLAGTKLENIESTTISLRNASTILKEIIDAKPVSELLITKIDCEGAEYEILEDLDSNNLLKHFDAFVIEWHHKGPQILIDRLLKNGFIILDTLPFTPECGMVYAFRMSK